MDNTCHICHGIKLDATRACHYCGALWVATLRQHINVMTARCMVRGLPFSFKRGVSISARVAKAVAHKHVASIR